MEQELSDAFDHGAVPFFVWRRVFADLYGAGDAGGVWAELFDGFMDYHLRLLFWVGSGRAAVFIFADPDRFFPALLVP